MDEQVLWVSATYHENVYCPHLSNDTAIIDSRRTMLFSGAPYYLFQIGSSRVYSILPYWTSYEFTVTEYRFGIVVL